MIFAEALTSLEEYRQFTAAIRVPVLANITEFGKTPLFTTKELGSVGVRLVLYPLSAFRAMSRAALIVYEALRKDGTQKSVIDLMQTRTELYDVLGYNELREETRRVVWQRRKYLMNETANSQAAAAFKPKKSVAPVGRAGR